MLHIQSKLLRFSQAVANYVAGGVNLVRPGDFGLTLDALVTANRRLAVFMPNATAEGILPSDPRGMAEGRHASTDSRT